MKDNNKTYNDDQTCIKFYITEPLRTKLQEEAASIGIKSLSVMAKIILHDYFRVK